MISLLFAAALAAPKEVRAARSALTPFVEDPQLERASVGVVVHDPSTGQDLYSYNADILLAPASTAKLTTAAAALDVLGPDWRFVTRIHAQGTLTKGVLKGDLAILGSGDPSLGVADPQAAVELWASQLKAQGITSITGDILANDRVFSWRPLGDGWTWDDGLWRYGAPITGLNLGHNTTTLTITGASKDGSPVKIDAGALKDCISLDNQATTGSASLAIDRPPFDPQVRLWGSLPRGETRTLTVSIVDPPLCAATLLKKVLIANGISVEGKVRRTDSTEGTELLRVESAPLSELLKETLKTSDNLYAEAIARSIDPEPIKSYAGASIKIAQTLAKAGITTDEYQQVDGSGLSRRDRMTAWSMVKLLDWSSQQTWGSLLQDMLPISGVDGTLAKRLAGTSAQGRLLAKTGTINGVSNLAGWLNTPNDRSLLIVMFVDGALAPAGEIRALQDQAILRLVESAPKPKKRRK